MAGKTASNEYNANSMRALKGLEPIRQSPSMYVGSVSATSAIHGRDGAEEGENLTAGGFHLFVEAFANAFDEASNGYADRIRIILHSDNSISVIDNGRGIPTDINKDTGKSGVYLAYLVASASGKMSVTDRKTGKKTRSNYKTASGLHGLGSACISALSDRVNVTVYKDGKAYSLSSQRGVSGEFMPKKGKAWFEEAFSPDAQRDIHEVADNRSESDKESFPHGTSVRWHPDPLIWGGIDIPHYDIIEYVKAQSYMIPNATCEIIDYTSLGGSDGTSPVITEYHHPGGINDMIDEKTQKTKNISPIISFDVPSSYLKKVTVEDDDGNMIQEDVSYNCEVRVAFRWTSQPRSDIEGYANGVHCLGKHVDGLRRGLTRGVSDWIKKSTLMTKKDEKDGVTVNVNDITDGIVAVIEVLLEDQCDFQGQTKDVLGNSEVLSCVSDVSKEQIRTWLDTRKNSKSAKAIGKSILDNARLRMKQKKERENAKKAKEKLGGFSNKPAKLVDCRNEGAGTELLICEGDSAAGAIKIARDANMQALMPVRGVSLNAYGQKESKILNNQEFADLTVAMGGGGIGENFDIEKRRYSRIGVYTDADPDGAYIRSLLLVFIYYCFPGMIEGGHVFAGCPPLYSIKVVKGKDKGKTLFAADEQERNRIVNDFMMKGGDLKSLEIARSKGLGEMDAMDEFKPCLDPKTRKVRIITLTDISNAREQADNAFKLLFSRKQDDKDERRAWIDDTFTSIMDD